MATQRIKQGMTYTGTLVARDQYGLPLNLAACELSIGMVTALGVAVPGITITAVPGIPGGAQMLAPAEATAAWPIGLLRCDVKISGGLVNIVDTFLLAVEQAITQ